MTGPALCRLSNWALAICLCHLGGGPWAPPGQRVKSVRVLVGKPLPLEPVQLNPRCPEPLRRRPGPLDVLPHPLPLPWPHPTERPSASLKETASRPRQSKSRKAKCSRAPARRALTPVTSEQAGPTASATWRRAGGFLWTSLPQGSRLPQHLPVRAAQSAQHAAAPHPHPAPQSRDNSRRSGLFGRRPPPSERRIR